MSENFTVEPTRGTLEPYCSFTCFILFAPKGSNKSIDDTLICKIEDGENKSLRCKGEVSEAKC